MCGKTALTHAPNWRFCSQKCKDQHWNRSLSCPDCGGPVWKSGATEVERPKCRACWRETQIAAREHGKLGTYRTGCRCDECRAANTRAAVAYQRSVRPARPSRECVVCATEFTPRTSAITCSPVCRKAYLGRTGDHRSRADLYGVEYEPIDRLEIFERDDWTCGICRLPVEQGLAFPDPGSATLDHVVPMSRGGGHVPANVQLAHFYCNTVKGNREC